MTLSNGLDHDSRIPSARQRSDMMCGLGPWKPEWLQACSRVGVFVGFYSIAGLMTSVLSTYIMSQITTIEKQFGFSSTQSGWLLSCNDIGYLMVTLFASYVAQKVHIPRVLWLSTVFYGIAGLMCALAYFISKDAIQQRPFELQAGNATQTKMPMFRNIPLCTNVSKGDNCESRTESKGVGLPSEYSTTAVALIAAGMVLQGIGKAPRYPFITAYLDDNGKKKNTAMYMGFIMGIAIFGPALAFAVGGLFSRIYVTLEDVSITPRHPSWIGAWWLGFLVFGAVSIVAAFPLLCFPRRMKPKPLREKASGGTKKKTVYKEFSLGFFRALLRLLRNPIYVLLVVSNCIGSFVISGSLSFSAKYIEAQFFLPAWKANILLGVVTIVSASLGTMCGGCLVTKRKLTPLGCVKLALLLTTVIGALTTLGYVFGCPNAEVVKQPSSLLTSTPSITPPTITESCATDCLCDENKYFPVCGSDGRSYFSPCMAGCTKQVKQLFQDCSCIGTNATAVPGLCDTGCSMLYPYLALSVVTAFIGTMGIMPGFIVLIRCVREEDKPLGVGLSSLLATLLGWFPGPVVFGRVIDATCMLWTTSCSQRGSCALYDNYMFRVSKVSFELFSKVSSIVFYLLIFIFARKKTDWSLENVEREKMEAADTVYIAKEPNHHLLETGDQVELSPMSDTERPMEREEDSRPV